jgi:hypothetical protein
MPTVVGKVTKGAVFDGIVDAADLSYTATVATDWDGDAQPGNIDHSLDQLAERVDDLEAAGGGAAHDLDGATHTGITDYTSTLGLLRLNIGDANFNAQLNGGNPNITFDGGPDSLAYDRTWNCFNFTVNSALVAQVSATETRVDHILEMTTGGGGHGVDIDGVLCKDGLVDGVDVSARDHARAHTIASASDHTGTADRVIYVDHAGAITELALGASGTYLKSNGATSAPTFDTPAGGGAMATDPLWDAAGDLAVGTGADTGAKLALTVPAGANLLNVLGVVNGETTPTWKALFDATHPENLGTAAEGSGTVAALRNHVHAMPKLDDVAAPDNNTDLNASTTAHGLAPLVVDPASAVQRHVLCVDNGEAVYKNADLFDATNPEPTGTAAPGTSLLAAHRDHVHAPAAYVATTDANWDGADEPDTTATALDQLAERITNAHVYIPASAMWPSTDNGCAWPARRESTNSRTNIFYAAFDPAADEYAEFSVVLPVWDQGTIDVTYHWTTVAAGGTTVVWGISATSLANDETLDTAYGAATNADADTVLAAHDFHVIADTGITVAGAGAGELIMCRISRATASDNCASDADLLGVIINYRKRDA